MTPFTMYALPPYRFQTKITQDREMLDKAINKVAAFRELSESLSKVSTVSAAAVVGWLSHLRGGSNPD